MGVHLYNDIGKLEVITGSMFSGKSEELIRRLRRAKYAKQKIVVFKHSIDNRYDTSAIFSHDKDSLEAYPVSTVIDMENIMKNNIDADVIGIDEVQFFGQDVVEFCKKYVKYGKRIIVAGLDMSFRAEPYHPMPELMGISDKTDKLQAICMVCGKTAYASQRLINGKPAYYDDPLVLVGANENYEARCRRHHIVRHRNENRAKIFFLLSTEINIEKEKVEKYYKNLLENKNNKIDTIMIDGYSFRKNNEENKLIQLREKINDISSKNDYILILITGGLLLNIEKNYNILDLMCEYRKQSEVIVVSKNKKEILNQILLILNLLKKSDLNVKEIVYTSVENEKEKEDIINVINENYEIKNLLI